jgi:membrane protein
MLMLLSQLLGVFGLSLETLQKIMGSYLTEEMTVIIEQVLSFTTSSGSNIIFTLVVLWSASKAQFVLIRMGSYTMSGGEITGGGFIKDRIRALVSIIMVIITIASGLILLVYGEIIIKFVLTTLKEIVVLPPMWVVGDLWLILRWPIAFGIYFLVVWVNYALMFHKRISLKKVAPGALFASIGILLVSFLYGLYTNLIANYDLIYGALASLVALMMWIYFISWCLGGGLIVNRAWMENK